MYPKMKVRDLSSPVGEEEDSSVFSDENFTTVHDQGTPGSNPYLTPSPPLAKVPGCYTSAVPMPPLLSSQGKTSKTPASEKKNAVTPLTGERKKESIIRGRGKGRGSPIPPPRAVLSSPDNDGKMLGEKQLNSRRSIGYIASPLSQVKLAKPENGKKKKPCMKIREEGFDKAKTTNTGRIKKEGGYNQCH